MSEVRGVVGPRAARKVPRGADALDSSDLRLCLQERIGGFAQYVVAQAAGVYRKDAVSAR